VLAVVRLNVCLLTNDSQKNTGHGIDRYSLELGKRLQQKCSLQVVSQGNLSNAVSWGVKELTFPFKVLPVKADVYHAVSQQIAKAPIISRKHPLVTTIHDLIPFNDSLTTFYERNQVSGDSVRFMYLRFCTVIAARSDLIIVPFEVTRKDIVSKLNVDSKKVRIICYGVDTEIFKPLKLAASDTASKRRKKVVFFVGGFNPRKGIDVLMEAFSKITKEQHDVELWICGKWNYFDGVALAKKLGISDYIRVLGHVPDSLLPMYYNLADLVVLPYRIGFSLPVLEAMACGKAVITSDTADLKEVVGGFVETVCPTDVERLAEAISRVLANESLRIAMGERAYVRAQSLSWDKMALKTLDVYSELYSKSYSFLT
jgi:glycosyltransferase involved in cell wall biosynthesis